jgi:hypothetical protein
MMVVGAFTALVVGLATARKMDGTVHAGVIVVGEFGVLIGG